MDIVEVKRRLRELKQIERKVRSTNGQDAQRALVWDAFFDLRETGRTKAKYSLRDLADMDREEYRRAVAAYWAAVYFELFRETGFSGGINRDPGALLQLGLPTDADEAAVKRRFRELAKTYHPDAGGDTEEFIRLMEAYRKLTGR
jgi:hypothetical protein